MFLKRPKLQMVVLCCDWKKDETYNVIFKRYATFFQNQMINTVVFDGYELSTKDTTHQKRAGNISQSVDIKEENPCPANRKSFLGNYQNKEAFVGCLAKYLVKCNFKVIECPSDADTSIVKETLNIAKDSPVTVFSDDTDILCLLIHHVAENPTHYPVYLTDMTKKKGHQRECYKVNDIAEKHTEIAQYLLFAHAFTGCDTTSAIHHFGKTAIFDKVNNSDSLKSIIRKFYQESSPEEIGNATIRFFELLHSPSDSLSTIRKKKNEQIVLSNRANIDPSSLPPSPRAAYYHGLRVYHQLKVWRELRNSDDMPLNWGWQIVGESFSPIMTDEEAGPPDLLKVIRCGCKSRCETNRCTCRKAGLKCTYLCKECHGISCTNSEPTINDPENEATMIYDEFEDRNFMDIFI